MEGPSWDEKLLGKAGLKHTNSTEALIMAAEEQDLSRGATEAGIYYIREDKMKMAPIRWKTRRLKNPMG